MFFLSFVCVIYVNLQKFEKLAKSDSSYILAIIASVYCVTQDTHEQDDCIRQVGVTYAFIV